MSELPTSPQLDLKILDLKKAGLVYRALNHKLRQQIIQMIHSEGRMTVTMIYCKLRVEQSVASQHLAILRKTGLVYTERDGKYIFYSIHYNRIRHIQESTLKLLN